MDEATASIPFVDEHARVIAAPAEQVWRALAHVVPRAFASPSAHRYARLIHCEPRGVEGAFPDEGATLPGFRVARSGAPGLLVLMGKHRFSTYALTFRIDALEGGVTRLRAETRASFPGPAGKAYRLAVIGTRMHALLLRRILRAVELRAAARSDLSSPSPR